MAHGTCTHAGQQGMAGSYSKTTASQHGMASSYSKATASAASHGSSKGWGAPVSIPTSLLPGSPGTQGVHDDEDNRQQQSHGNQWVHENQQSHDNQWGPYSSTQLAGQRSLPDEGGQETVQQQHPGGPSRLQSWSSQSSGTGPEQITGVAHVQLWFLRAVG